MPRLVHARQRETIDAICYRVLGATADVTEQTLELNPNLATLGPQLPAGTAVTLPDPPTHTPLNPQVQLWD